MSLSGDCHAALSWDYYATSWQHVQRRFGLTNSHRPTHMPYLQQLCQLHAALVHPLAVSAVNHVHECVCGLKIVAPVMGVCVHNCARKCL